MATSFAKSEEHCHTRLQRINTSSTSFACPATLTLPTSDACAKTRTSEAIWTIAVAPFPECTLILASFDSTENADTGQAPDLVRHSHGDGHSNPRRYSMRNTTGLFRRKRRTCENVVQNGC